MVGGDDGGKYKGESKDTAALIMIRVRVLS